jgi:phosphoglycolate phosphatase-like HAD superfamily hydrolase
MPPPQAPHTPPKPTTPAVLRPTLKPRPEITHVVFDFDGTLSWVRHGWPEIMQSVFTRHWVGLESESLAQRDSIFNSIIIGMNGRPTILQMERFARVLAGRGLNIDPEVLRAEYQARLDLEIQQRLALIRSNHTPKDAFVVHGGRLLLEWLNRQSLELIVLSSTIEHRVREEAEALGLAHFFRDRIYGSGDNPSIFSKMTVFEKILHEDGISGENVLSFGDGPVEIACTKTLGGLAIAICSDETDNGSGKMDPAKQAQLLEAGADAAYPDFRDIPSLMEYLLQK